MASDLLNVFRFYHAGGEIRIGCNASFIALIPNIYDIAEFRSISMFGCLYKVYSKNFAKGLKKDVPEVIGVNQSAFLAWGYILEGSVNFSQ